MNVEVNMAVVANNRKPISMIGSNLGGKIFKASAREAWPNFDDEKNTVDSNDNVEIILNRSPRRYRMLDVDILSVAIHKDATGTNKVFFNENTDTEFAIPVTSGMERFGIVTDNAISEALRGDKSKIFADPQKLAGVLNTFNRDERTRLVNLKAKIDKMIQQIDTTISENEQKTNMYERELRDSAPAIDPMASRATGTTIVVEKANDED